MGVHTYYCEVTQDRSDYKSGVYKVALTGGTPRWVTDINRLITVSERVWVQGPMGGVRIIKEPWHGGKFYGRKYLTTNPQAMQEFAWVKLTAK